MQLGFSTLDVAREDLRGGTRANLQRRLIYISDGLQLGDSKKVADGQSLYASSILLAQAATGS